MTNENKPKIWNLRDSNDPERMILDAFPEDFPGQEHLIKPRHKSIEYSAFQKIQEENEIKDKTYDLLFEQYRDLKIKNAEMKNQLESAREVIGFYGNEMNYSIDDYNGISGEMRKRCVLYKDCDERNDVYSYAGRRARQWLENNKEEKDNA